jgi:hydrogenase maturation protein HypF
MRLEASIEAGEEGSYSYKAGEMLEPGPIIEGIVRDITGGVGPGKISARFHNTISMIILETVSRISNEYGIRKVALSGGTFQNRYLSERIEKQLVEVGFELLLPLQLPANDGGIALGQLAVASKKRSLGLI